MNDLQNKPAAFMAKLKSILNRRQMFIKTNVNNRADNLGYGAFGHIDVDYSNGIGEFIF